MLNLDRRLIFFNEKCLPNLVSLPASLIAVRSFLQKIGVVAVEMFTTKKNKILARSA
jgi:hypothetical protein